MARRIAANSLLDNRMDDVRSSEPANATRRRWNERRGDAAVAAPPV
ncbi:hypothetical protein F444_11258 [Phytophthora nicotianae P1976]|uniref:Uncharacterized protein n=1 Tax=Phytophthora nicotianae P1976 TaxID=1317066 RepID=A0A081A1H3_PHYNI|nr:hypothetical protein F444_11258 [Phytophthora nicotianae P1976]